MNFIFENIIYSKSLQVIFSGILAFLITWNSIPVIIQICNLRNLMEHPIKRSSHFSPTPTFGGVAIFSSTVVGYMLWNFQDEGYLMHKVMAGLIILFFLGIKDDMYSINALKKMASQIVVAVLVVVGGDLRITSFFGICGIYEIPYILSVVFSVFLIVALINAFNLIDGIDGLSGGIGMLSSFGFSLWFSLNNQWSLACLGFSLSFSLLAFLRFNFSTKNKIFMGDTGSLIIGFTISILAIQFVQLNVFNFNNNTMYKSAPVLAIVLLSVPIFDTMRVFAIRILKGKSPFKADRLHLHHLMVDNGLSHVATSFVLYFFTLGFTSVTYLLRYFYTNTQLSIGVLVVFSAYLLVGYLLEVRRFKLYKTKNTLGIGKDELQIMPSAN